jgi:hypothetical protein
MNSSLLDHNCTPITQADKSRSRKGCINSPQATVDSSAHNERQSNLAVSTLGKILILKKKTRAFAAPFSREKYKIFDHQKKIWNGPAKEFYFMMKKIILL